jgi:hypothetical protein
MGPPSGGLTGFERRTVLTTVRAYSSVKSVDKLLLADGGRAETDFLQVTNITGLGPVDASITTVPFGTLDGDSYSGSSVSRRNIVLTVKPNPNWVDWTYEKLRRLLYTYFMPKALVKLVFETDEIDPVEILGYVESIDPDIFSKAGEIQISVICPYPHFTSVEQVTVIGSTDATEIELNYDGSIETGINLEVRYNSGVSNPTVTIYGLSSTPFQVGTTVSDNNYFVMNSVPGNKYARMIEDFEYGGVITNILSDVYPGSDWPMIEPGLNTFSIETVPGVQDFVLRYYKRYGGL